MRKLNYLAYVILTNGKFRLRLSTYWSARISVRSVPFAAY